MFGKILPWIDKILRYANDVFVVKDTQNKIIFVNERIKKYGYEPDELVGKDYMCLLSSKHKGKRFRKIVREKLSLNYEVEFLRSDGSIVNAVESNAPVLDDDGNTVFVVSILTDISLYKRLQERLKKSAHMDYLTGLYNVRYFYKRIREEIKRAERKNEKIGVIILDIDNFKKYNDLLGHERGNQLLRKVGRVIKNSIREGVDIGFRFGGDEFIILVNQAEENVMKEISSRIREKFLGLSEPFLDLSMGIAYYKPEQNIKDLIVEADQKLYRAKGSDIKIIG